MSEVTLTKSTLIPVSFVFIVVSASFWISGLAKDVQASAEEIVRMRSERTSLEAEIIQEMRSQAITMQQLEIKAALLDTKLTLLVQMAKEERKQNEP
jgi:uncharacterized protein YqfA (UPF0365 family)